MKMENLKRQNYLGMVYLLGQSKFNIALVLCFLSFALIGQKTKPFEEYVKTYKGQPEVVISDSEKYVIKKSKTGLSIIQEKYTESLVLNDLGARQQKERFYSSELSPVIDYNAYIITKNDKKVKIKDFNESNNDNSSIFFDDVKKIEVTYSGVEPGVRKVLSYQTKFTDPNLLHRYIFKTQYAAEEMKFEVEIDNDIKLGYKILNDTGNITFKKEVKSRKTLYQWTMKNSTPYKWEPGNPGILYHEPHIEIFIEDAEIEDKPIFLGDVSKLYAYYRTFVNELNQNIDQELIDIAIDVSKDHETEEEKCRCAHGAAR
jgi:hypothetical protein